MSKWYKISRKQFQSSEFGVIYVSTMNEEKYITIDYANIHEYMKKDLEISVISYYDSGLVGFNQQFPDGMILYNGTNYLNIYNVGSNPATDNEEKSLNGVYMLRETYEQDSAVMSLFNY